MRFIIFCSLIIFLQGCLVSRGRRPILTGYIVDSENKKPIIDCKVGETKTDSNGFFKLKEIRYKEFTIPGYEAPPIFIKEIVAKENYVSDTIVAFNKYGGAMRKGTEWKIDTIYLKKIK